MPAQSTQTEEENLIILDDVISDTALETTPEIKIEEPVSSENIIDFGDDINDTSLNLGDIDTDNVNINEEVSDLDLGSINTEQTTIKKELSDSSTSLDLGDFNLEENNTSTEVKNTDTLEDNNSSTEILEENSTSIDNIMPNENLNEDASLAGDLSLDSSSEELGNNSEELLGSTEKEDSSDLNSILDGTIIQLQSRSDIISEDKEVEQGNIKDYKEQIATLEENVANSEGIVATLNKEGAKIRSNIKSLERMKLKDEVEEVKKETSTKVHNSKRSR